MSLLAKNGEQIQLNSYSVNAIVVLVKVSLCCESELKSLSCTVRTCPLYLGQGMD